MNQKFYTLFAKYFFGAILISGSLLSAEEAQNIEVGSRAMSHAKKVAVYEQIAEQEKKGAEEQSEEVTEETSEDALLKADASLATAAASYKTTHEGAYHYPVSVSAFGDTVEIEDGSIWQVSSSDKSKTLNWMTSDVLVITQNTAWFSSYDYVIVNVSTGVDVKVNMLLGPYYNGAFTHWASAIDYSGRKLYLEDGSIWEVGGTWASYQDVLDTWLPNDTILIGLNGDSSPTTPNILINVNTNTWVKAKCVY